MAFGNVTVPPLASAQSVRKPEIGEVLDLDTGEYIEAIGFIRGHRYQALIETRNKILERMRAERTHYVCALCGVAVYLCSTAEKQFFFRHRIEDGSCPARTRSPLSYEEICARKYHGLRESEPHRRIKKLIEDSLAADATFTEIASEKNWKSSDDAKRFRRPDVQATREGNRFAFEVQLSTTFLSVVVGRRMFYRDEGALLAWVFGSFDPAYRRLTTDDLLFSNNSNVFVVDEETVARSIEARAFQVRCFHRIPVRNQGELTDDWVEAIVPFGELTQDRDGQRLFYFDYERAERELHDEIAREEAEGVARKVALEAERVARAVSDEAEKLERERQVFLDFWRSKGRYWISNVQNGERWAVARNILVTQGLDMPLYPDGDSELRAMLNALVSAMDGRPVGWDFKRLVEVGHHLLSAHPRQLLAFGYANRQFERGQLIDRQDGSGKWKAKCKVIAARLKVYAPSLMPDRRLLPHMRFLFPKVAADVDAYLIRASWNIA